MKVYLKLVDGINGKVPMLCLEDGTVLDGQYRIETAAAVDEAQTVTASFFVEGWIED